MATPSILRIAINAQILRPDTWGGVSQFIIGLVKALGKLDGSEEYLIVTHPGNRDWLNPYLGANQRIAFAPSKFEFAKRLLGPFRFAIGSTLARVSSSHRSDTSISIPDSDGFYETLGVAAAHFPHPYFVNSNLPLIYTPHDLQHLHYPQFFTSQEIARRNAFYAAGCRTARAITTDARWVKDDICERYAIAPGKVFSIPMAPSTEVYPLIAKETLAQVQQTFGLPEIFVLYPANTWEHKNHVRLLEALAQLRDGDQLHINLVCTGRKNDFWRNIEKRIVDLGLGDQIRFLDYVSAADLRALYHFAQFVVFPSLFEGGGLPVLEAFRERAPVACSNVTSLPEYAGNAALLFDPSSVASIAEALRRMTSDTGLREELRQRGSARVQLFTWERTAKTYRALYRQVAGAPLSDEDRALLTDASK